jgi:hypothetical protein
MSVPLYIPTFNNPTYTFNFINQVAGLNFSKIIIMDNNSTYPPMIKLLNELESKYEVIRLDENLGPHLILRNPEYYKSLPDIFALSDPDVEFPKVLPSDFQDLLIKIGIKHRVGKVGFAIEVPSENEFLELIVNLDGKLRNMHEWEQQFWENEIDRTSSGDPVYLTTLDTQFAIYNKEYFNPEERYKALRIGGNYTSKHLGFYKKSIVPKEESDFYRSVSKYAYYIGNFDENGIPYTKLPVHSYYQLTERLEGAERELKRVTFERDKYLSELELFYKSNSWKIISLLLKFKEIMRVK